MSALSCIEPKREEDVRMEVLIALESWSQGGIGVLFLSVVVTLVAACIVPFSQLDKHTAPVCFAVAAIGLTLISIAVLVTRIPLFFGAGMFSSALID